MLIRSEVTGKYILDLRDPAVGTSIGAANKRQIVFTAALQTDTLPDRFFQSTDLQTAITAGKITVLSFDAGDEFQAGSEPVENLATSGAVDTVPISNGSGGLAMGVPTGAAHALGGASHTADTIAALNAKVSDATLDDTGTARTPTAHALGGAEHSADTIAALNAKVSDATLIDTADSRLSDARTPTSHAFAGAEHSTSLLTAVNTKISDATLIDTADSRLSDARAPTAHKDDHKSGGGDAFASADLLEATIKRILTTTGPTTLLVGAIVDGEYLKRSGTAIVSSAVAAGGFFSDGGGTDAVIGKGAITPVAAGGNAFAQGDECSAGGLNSFAQGDNCDAGGLNSFAQGNNNTLASTNGVSFSQGYYNQVGANSSYVFVQGGSNVIGGTDSNTLVQGNKNDTNSPSTFAQGYYNIIAASCSRSFVQGDGNNLGSSSPYSFAQGYYNIFTGSASTSFAQGFRNEVKAARGFAQGYYAETTRADQKAWSSQRASLGGAQFSHMTKHLETTDDTVTTLIDLALDQDKAYAIWCHVIARNTTTDDEVASFFLGQATAYRDTAGAAVLLGAPTFTKEAVAADPGPGNASFTVVIDANVNSIRIRVTGEPAAQVATYEWCGTIKFTEVKG